MFSSGRFVFVGLSLLAGAMLYAVSEEALAGSREKLVFGWLEPIVLRPWDLVLPAKLDTGANTASLDADDIDFFKKKGQTWVRFALVMNRRNEKPNHKISIERPLERIVYIRDHFWEPQKRPVVKLQFCLNGSEFETDFNLVDRSKFNYPVLLGRRFLHKVALVDANAKRLTKTNLKECNPDNLALDQKPHPERSQHKSEKSVSTRRSKKSET